MISQKSTLTIDLNVIRNNYRILQKFCASSEVGAAVKANCYGLGKERIAPILEDEGCKHFFVANKDEALFLRNILKKQNSNIYVLNGYFANDKKDFLENNLIPILNSSVQFKLWENVAYDVNKKLPCLVHINTGINRLGMPAIELADIANRNLNILCIVSHLSSSEDPLDPFNLEQLKLFEQLSLLFPDAKKSLANSSGIFLGQDYHFDITRPGAALYGINVAPYLENYPIKNPITLTAPIIQINSLSDGEFIGYNRTYRTTEKTIVATLPLGYADGYLRALSNKGIVFINNKEARVLGRISMDLMNVDVTNIPEKDLFLGQSVEIIGHNITPDKIANLAGTNAYEILTMLGNRYHRVYS